MDVTKPYKFIGFRAMDATKPYKFIGFRAMDVTKPYKFIGFGILHVTQQWLRAVNRPSGPDIGRTATGKAPKSALPPAEGRPEGRFRCFPGSSPAKIWPGRPIYGPEPLLHNIE